MLLLLTYVDANKPRDFVQFVLVHVVLVVRPANPSSQQT
jgi:hypothetical protein